jgi:hypothetical protein
MFLNILHSTRITRNQMTISSLESRISADNPSPFIDAFAKKTDTQKPS